MTPEPVQIPLTRGMVALVDAADAERVLARRWYADFVDGRCYAVSPKGVLLHRFIVDAPPRTPVGFVNGDSLDCRRENLTMRKGVGYYARAPEGERPRESMSAEGREPLPPWSRKPRGASGYVGVASRQGAGFRAHIKMGGVRRHLGCFATARDAALAYNAAHRLLRGAGYPPPNDVEPAVPLSQLPQAGAVVL